MRQDDNIFFGQAAGDGLHLKCSVGRLEMLRWGFDWIAAQPTNDRRLLADFPAPSSAERREMSSSSDNTLRAANKRDFASQYVVNLVTESW